MTESAGEDDKVGYRKPPTATRFREGVSGNIRGRPKGRRNQLPYETVLGRLVTISEGGVERRATAEDAFILYLVNEGLKGDVAAARQTREAFERAKAVGLREFRIRKIVRTIVSPGSVTPALEPLRMARKLDRYRETANLMLEPWLVEMALARLGDRRLTIEQQHEVTRATRTPGRVRWPKWWKVSSYRSNGIVADGLPNRTSEADLKGG